MQWLFIFSLAIITTFQGSRAQQCTEANQTAYVLSLPDGFACGVGFFNANNTPTGEAGMNALDTICTTACAGAVATWLADPNECNDTSSAAGLGLWCQPADGGSIPRCRWALDLAPPTLFNNTNLYSCGLVSPANPTCPPTCATGLSELANYIGCCYQFIYNNTYILDGLQERGHVTVMERQQLTGLADPLLWQLCNVDIPSACTSPTYRTPPPATTVPAMVTTASSNIIRFSVATLLLSFLCTLLN